MGATGNGSLIGLCYAWGARGKEQAVFGLKRSLFGRKGVAPQEDASAPPETSFSGGAALTVADIRERCTRMGLPDGRSPGSLLFQVVSSLSPEEVAAVLVSTASDVTLLGGYHSDPSKPGYWSSNCHDSCLRREAAVRAEHTPALLTLLVGNEAYLRHYNDGPFSNLLKLIKQALADGGFLTSADTARLADLALRLRAQAGKEHDKPKQKALVKRAEAVEKLGNVEVSATSRLMERCEGAHNPHACAEQPANYRFWSELLAAFLDGLHEIRASLAVGRQPDWMKSPATFAISWPPVGPVTPAYGDWTKGGDNIRDFAVLRQLAKKRRKGQQSLVDPNRVRTLPELRAVYAPTFAWVWNTAQIPALDVLADLERPGWTELLEHLITARMAPRPTAAWRKRAVMLADATGRDQVAIRLQQWLELFHSPPLDRISFADRMNAEAMDHQVAALNEALPDWPEQVEQGTIPAVGRALAMVAASGGNAALPNVFVPDFLEANDHRYDGKSVTEGMLRLSHARWRDLPRDWLRVSLENETLLRGALWLGAEIMDRAAAISTIEATALAAAARLHLGDNSQRSKVVANAAIATLIDLKGSDVDAAVYRLSQAIPDRTINPPLFKALNSSGEAQPASE
jgi:hypothetical protein